MKNNNKEKNKLIEVFDVLFIMILCFATLLTAMVMQGAVSESSSGRMDYTVHGISFVITISALVIYVVYMINKSHKQLKEVINAVYSNEMNCIETKGLENKDEFERDMIV